MLKLLLGDPNTRKLKRYQPIVEEINFLEEEISQLNDDDLPKIIDNDFNTRDFLTSTKYNWKNISLDPFQVIWLGAL